MPDHKLKKDTESKTRGSQEARTQEVETENTLSPDNDLVTQLSGPIGDSSSARKHASILRRAIASQPSRAEDALLQMQRQYGNRYVQRVLELARKGDDETEVAPEVEKTIERKRGGGQALDSNVRAQMEPAFRADFSGVQVHTDVEADKLNRRLNARAFTTGEDIFFRQGAYSPGSSSGRELLAHELTHVVQQTGGAQRKLTIGQSGDKYEQEADAVAQAILRQEQQVAQRESGEVLVRRQVEEEEEEEPVQTKAEVARVQQQAEEEEEETIQAKTEDLLVQLQVEEEEEEEPILTKIEDFPLRGQAEEEESIQAMKPRRGTVKLPDDWERMDLLSQVNFYYENWFALSIDDLNNLSFDIKVSLELRSPKEVKEIYENSKAIKMLDRGFELRKAFRDRMRGKSLLRPVVRKRAGRVLKGPLRIAAELDIRHAKELVKKHYDASSRILNTQFANWHARLTQVEKLISLPDFTGEDLLLIFASILLPIGARQIVENKVGTLLRLGEAVKDTLREAMKTMPKAKQALVNLEMPFTVSILDWRLDIFNELATKAEIEREAMQITVETLALRPEYATPGSLQDAVAKFLGPCPEVPDGSFEANSKKIERILWEKYVKQNCHIAIFAPAAVLMRINSKAKKRFEAVFDGKDAVSIARGLGWNLREEWVLH